MKATITYDLSDLEDRRNFLLAQDAPNLMDALCAYDDWLRKQHKYGADDINVTWPVNEENQEDTLNVIKQDCAYEIRSALHELLSTYDVNLSQ